MGERPFPHFYEVSRLWPTLVVSVVLQLPKIMDLAFGDSAETSISFFKRWKQSPMTYFHITQLENYNPNYKLKGNYISD